MLLDASKDIWVGLDQDQLIGFLIALGIGILMGLEREYAKKGDSEDPEIFAGIRTFPLVSIMGYLLMLLATEFSIWVFTLGLVGVMTFVVVSYVTSFRQKKTGGTTQMAIIIAFLLGGLVQAGLFGIAILSGVVVTILLALKIELHSAIGKFGQQDIFAILKFVVLTVLVYPFLPDQTYGPYDVLNPREIWMIVMILLGIDFLGYLLGKFIGTRKGTIITGVLGGFASSTAVAWSFSRKSRQAPEQVGEYGGAIVLASSIMFPRVLIWLYIWNKSLFTELALPVIMIGILGVGAGILIIRRMGGRSKKMEHEMKNPLNLRDALVFGVLYAGILLLVAFARENFGEKGVYLASGISGLTDVDAITISMSKLGGNEFSLFVSHVSVVIGMIANSFLKYGICLGFGSGRMRKAVTIGFLPLILATMAYLAIKWFLIT